MSDFSKQSLAMVLAAIVLATAGGTAVTTPVDASPGKKVVKMGGGGVKRTVMRDQRLHQKRNGRATRQRNLNKMLSRERTWARSGNRAFVKNDDGSKTLIITDSKGRKTARKIGKHKDHYVSRTDFGTKTVIFNGDGTKTIIKKNRAGRIIGRKTVKRKKVAARLRNKNGTTTVVKNRDGTMTVIKRDRKGRKISRKDVRKNKRARYTVRTVHGTRTVVDNGNGTKTVILRTKSGKVYSASTVPMRGGRRVTAKSTYRGVTTTVLRNRDGTYKVTKTKVKTVR